ncbi:MAG: alpha/beta hydrolase [Erysipelotrichales bacterium]
MRKKITVLIIFVLAICSINIEAKTSKTKKKNIYNAKYNTASRYQKLDVYYPKEINANGNNKVVLFIHGGSYAGGDKRDYYQKNSKYFNDAGIVYISMNYRRSGVKKYPGAIDDTKTAIRYLKAHSKRLKINPNKIVLMGHSAGANLGSIVASTPKVKSFGKEKVRYKKYSNYVAGYIGVAGYYNTNDFLKKPMKTNSKQRTRIKRYYYSKNKKVYKNNLVKGNASRYAKGIKVPSLLISGKQDKTISYKQTQKYCATLKKNKKYATCYYKDNSGHSLGYYQNEDDFKVMIDYVKRR